MNSGLDLILPFQKQAKITELRGHLSVIAIQD